MTPHLVDDLVDDMDAVVASAVVGLRSVLDLDWSVRPVGSDWSCRGIVEHLSDDFFAYAAQLAPRTPAVAGRLAFVCTGEPDGDEQTVHTEHQAGNAGVVDVLEACGGLLVAVARTAGPEHRAFHAWGVTDADGSAAMGTVETLLHVHDVAGALGLAWDPDPSVVRRATERLFPDAPTGHAPWPTLLWLTGRGDLPGHAPVSDWRWDAAAG